MLYNVVVSITAKTAFKNKELSQVLFKALLAKEESIIGANLFCNHMALDRV